MKVMVSFFPLVNLEDHPLTLKNHKVYKLIFLTFKALNGLAPKYLCVLIGIREPKIFYFVLPNIVFLATTVYNYNHVK